MAEKRGLAQRRWKTLSEAMDHDQQRPERRTFDKAPHPFDEQLPGQRFHVAYLDLLVLEPVGRIDQHAEPERWLDLGIEKTESQLFPTCAAKPLLHRTRLISRDPIGHVGKPIDPTFTELGDRHPPEHEALGPMQRGAGGAEVDKVEPAYHR
jgi:hypothetical protein